MEFYRMKLMTLGLSADMSQIRSLDGTLPVMSDKNVGIEMK